MKQSRHKIKEIQEGSIAQELELEAGDELISINGQPVEDVFDYHYLVNDEYIELLVKKTKQEKNGSLKSKKTMMRTLELCLKIV